MNDKEKREAYKKVLEQQMLEKKERERLEKEERKKVEAQVEARVKKELEEQAKKNEAEKEKAKERAKAEEETLKFETLNLKNAKKKTKPTQIYGTMRIEDNYGVPQKPISQETFYQETNEVHNQDPSDNLQEMIRTNHDWINTTLSREYVMYKRREENREDIHPTKPITKETDPLERQAKLHGKIKKEIDPFLEELEAQLEHAKVIVRLPE